MHREIAGVLVKELTTHQDERGFFREILRTTDDLFAEGEFAQWSHSKMRRNVVKAWHYHHLQYDWWYLPIGCAQVVLIDNRAESETYREKMIFCAGDPESFPDARAICIRIPPGVLHGLKVLSEQAHLFYITSKTYNPNDEGRIPFNSTTVGHDWGTDALAAPNDCREFLPTEERQICCPD